MRKRTLRISTAQHVLGSLSRTLLALTFLFSGFVKAVDPLGTVYKIQDYLHEGFGGMLQWAIPMAGTAAVLLICMEMLLGVCMLLNVRTRVMSVITLLFYLVMTPLTLYIAIANPVSDCGCFGDALVITNWQTFWKNIILLCFAITLMICRKSIPQLWNGWAEICIALIGIGAAAGIMGYSYTHLPLIDFRPYKVGNYLPPLMEDGKPAVKEYIFTYEKDGVQQKFKSDECPSREDGWTYVDREDIVIEKEKQATIHDFEILRKTYDEEYEEYMWEDLTYDILESEQPVTLVIMYDLNKTDRKQIDKLTAIIHDRPDVYFLTGSGEEEIAAFAEELGWDEETAFGVFCFTDPVTLKTIVRANPGIVVLQNGTVMEKHNMRNYNLNF